MVKPLSKGSNNGYYSPTDDWHYHILPEILMLLTMMRDVAPQQYCAAPQINRSSNGTCIWETFDKNNICRRCSPTLQDLHSAKKGHKSIRFISFLLAVIHIQIGTKFTNGTEKSFYHSSLVIRTVYLSNTQALSYLAYCALTIME